MSRSRPIHPLRQAFNEYIWQHYHVHIGGDPKPELTEQAAAKVAALGIDYKQFVELACQLWDKSKQGQYPYWLVITCNRTFEMLHKVIDGSDTILTDGRQVLFESELRYASQYLEWLEGYATKPVPPPVPTPQEIKTQVAQYLCSIRGLSFKSSNYNDIYRSAHER